MTAPSHPAEPDPIPPPNRIGRDELNLAEFPIALLADRAPKDRKTLYFEDQHGRLTVTGSDAYGLPTAADTDVIVALLYLTKLRNGFRDTKVSFSRYELLQLLNWPDDGGFYKRLDQAFNRWSGVLLVYYKCWWNNKPKRYTSAKMHIIESVVMAEREGPNREGSSDSSSSTFTWNKTFIESCQADNLRQLDLDTYFSLKSAISKRLYRFLGKRFYLRDDWTFDLNEVAFDRVGLSRGYEGNAGKIKEKLQPALDELEAIGFLRPFRRDERYTRVDRGRWTIRLARPASALVAPRAAGPPLPAVASPPPAEPPPPLVAALVARGVTEATARELVQEHAEARLAAKIDVFDWMTAQRDRRVQKSPAGYLVASIRREYAPPQGYVPPAERALQEADAARARADQAAAARARARARARDEDRAIAAYWERLTPAERAALDAEARAQGPSAVARLARTVLRDDLIRARLRDAAPRPLTADR